MANVITITKYKSHKDSTLGAWKYWHLISFREDGYKYDLNATDECMMNITEQFEKAGNEVIFDTKD